jgi:amino acid adenylation domain-containing protein
MNARFEMSSAKRQLLQRMLSGGGTAGAGADDIGAVVRRAGGTKPPISLEQQNVWLHASMAPDRPLYNEPITIHRKGSFDLAVMEKSFNEILRRHEAWRTSFELVDGEVQHVVHDDLRVSLPLIDLTIFPAAERESEALRIATEDARRSFDLAVAPLFRAQVLKLADDDHRLHLTLHHIIFDGVSIYRIVVPELSAIYAAFSSGQDPALPGPVLQYGDYAIWRERHAASDSVGRQMDYWRRQLAGTLPVLQLPTDRPRPSRSTYKGSMETFSLSGALTETLKDFSRQQGVTLYMTLLAAFKALLHRYSGQEDIIIGGVTDTRRRPELENVVGYFLNSLVLRTRPSGNLRFDEFLTQTRDAVVGALGASDVPFDRIVREVQPKRDMSAHPLFQVLFSVEPPAPTFAPGWDLTQMDVTIGAAKFDLYLELDERPEGLIGRFLYSTDLFDAATIRRMIGHWRTMLEAIVADPDCTLARLPLLTPEESRQLFVEWNDTGREYPQAPLHECFEAQVRRTPDAVAVEYDGHSWTYRELDRRASVLAARLREAGVNQGMLVGICIERSLDMVASLLAILKAGGAYLPLDPTFPQKRLALILDGAGPELLLTQRALTGALPESSARVLYCNEDVSDPGVVSAFPSGVGSEDLAYVIYTSGSTGNPKGVEVPHRAVVNLLASMQQEPGFGVGDTLLAVTTLSFDIAALELFLPLLTGGRLIIASRDIASDPARLADLIRRCGCTVMQATPATWRALIETGWSGSKDLKILCGGEALPRELADKLLTRGESVWNMYGPTETTIWSTLHKVRPGSRSVPIGRPIANTQAYVLDASGNQVPIGVIGELHIGGSGVARGYRNHEELTRDRFIESPIAPGRRLYRTGDLARYRTDGEIECLGRTDNQVKIRGFRVELEEIEAALAAHPAIASAAVKAWPDASGETSLVAYLVSGDQAMPSAGELRRFLRQGLPGYMVPSRYIHLPALPMTPNRKVDRNALSAPEQLAPNLAYVAPLGQQEKRLAEIWKDVLRVRSVSTQDNFFDLGGHSLLIAKLLRRMEVEFGVRLPMAAVFNAPELQSMAALLNDPHAAGRLARTIAIQPNGSRPPLFWLNDAQIVRPLAEALGPDQPFLGVTLDPREERALGRSPELADIAACLVRTIRSAQPSGPYYVGGWCTSGILAFEVASQLKAAGHDVGLVILLHATNPVHFDWTGKIALELGRLKHGLLKTFRLRGWKKWNYAAERASANLGRILRERFRSANGNEPPAFSEILDLAAVHYVPKLYAGDVVLFQPAKRPRVLDYRAGWADAITGEFSAFEIKGTHYTILEQPNVRELGAVMAACLRRAQAATPRVRKLAS